MMVATQAAGGALVERDRKRIDDALTSCIGLLKALCRDEVGDVATTELEYVRAALTQHEADRGSVVKALEWEPNPNGDDQHAGCIMGRYDVSNVSGGFMAILRHETVDDGSIDTIVGDDFETVEDAIAAAQADYESRIRSALASGGATAMPLAGSPVSQSVWVKPAWMIEDLERFQTHDEVMGDIRAASGVTTLSYEEAIAIYLRGRGILRDAAECLGEAIPDGWQPLTADAGSPVSEAPGEVDEDGLRSCPFCGGRAYVVSGAPGSHYARCFQCHASTDDGSYDRAVEIWNKRAASPAQPTPPAGAVLPVSDAADEVDIVVHSGAEVRRRNRCGKDDEKGSISPSCEHAATMLVVNALRASGFIVSRAALEAAQLKQQLAEKDEALEAIAGYNEMPGIQWRSKFPDLWAAINDSLSPAYEMARFAARARRTLSPSEREAGDE